MPPKVPDQLLTFPFCSWLQAPIVIVGNKSDLPGKLKRVSYEQASYFAHQQRCSFVESSARKNQHVKEAFEMVVKQATDRHLQTPKPQEVIKKSNRKSKDCIIQ